MNEPVTSAAKDNWDRHWKQYTETAEENPAQRYRRDVILSLVEADGSGEGIRLLDVGSGQGDLALAVRRRFPAAEILGLELSLSGVEISRRKVPNATFHQCDLLRSVSPPDAWRGWATHAVCSEVIEHVDDPCELLKNARAYMAAGCELIVTAPGGPMSAFDKHIGHRKHWEPGEINTLFCEAGYVPQYVTGVGFPFFNLYRCVVIMRGQKLIQDASSDDGKTPSLGARAAMAVFRGLIRPNLNSSRRGWQMIGKARAT
jgi:cyclopropane fatty-acyl-phospholipid synthase-like methyltransferase